MINKGFKIILPLLFTSMFLTSFINEGVFYGTCFSPQNKNIRKSLILRIARYKHRILETQKKSELWDKKS